MRVCVVAKQLLVSCGFLNDMDFTIATFVMAFCLDVDRLVHVIKLNG